MTLIKRARVAMGILLGANAMIIAGMLADGVDLQPNALLAATVGFVSLAVASLELPQGDLMHVGIGPVVAAVLLLPMNTGVVGVGLGVTLTLMIASRSDAIETVAIDVLRYPILAALGYEIVTLDLTSRVAVLGDGALLAGAFLVGLVLVTLDLLSYAAVAAACRAERPTSAMNRLSRLVGSLYLGEASVGVALALVWPVMGALGGLVLLALMLLMKHSFGLYLHVRAAYGKTVGVLARLAEFENHESHGHAERVADIATSIGRVLRLNQPELERLGLAALLHDIGKVSSREAHGAEVSHTESGSRIVASVEFLSDLAPIVASHHAAAIASGCSVESLLAGIIHAASDFDHLVTSSTSRQACHEALKVMHSRRGEYFPDVLTALQVVRGL